MDIGAVRVELRAISIHTHHGVTEAEREVGQRLEVGVALDLAACEAAASDELEGTADYAEVCDLVVSAATERSYRTLERLAQVIAERLLSRFDAERVVVRAAKPAPPLSQPVGEAAVEVSLGRGDSV